MTTWIPDRSSSIPLLSLVGVSLAGRYDSDLCDFDHVAVRRTVPGEMVFELDFYCSRAGRGEPAQRMRAAYARAEARRFMAACDDVIGDCLLNGEDPPDLVIEDIVLGARAERARVRVSGADAESTLLGLLGEA